MSVSVSVPLSSISRFVWQDLWRIVERRILSHYASYQTFWQFEMNTLALIICAKARRYIDEWENKSGSKTEYQNPWVENDVFHQ